MESARLQQISYADQLFMIQLNDKKCLLHSVVGGRLAICGDRDRPSARFEDAPGTLQSFTTDRVEDDVHSRDVILKALRLIIDDLVGAQRRYELQGFARTQSPSHARHEIGLADALQDHDVKLSKREVTERVRELLQWVGLRPEVANMFPHELSGGMKQRICIAIA